MTQTLKPDPHALDRKPRVDLDRSSCPARHHGTYWAFSKHNCRCPDAGEEHRLYRRRRRKGHAKPLVVNSIGAVRRVRALAAIGYSAARIAAEAGVSERTVRMLQAGQETILARKDAAIRTAYRRLEGTTLGPPKAGARRGQWPNPMAWEDHTIDDPDGKPFVAADDDTIVDRVVLDRALAGGCPPMTPLERHHAIHLGVRRGMTLSLIAARLHISHTNARKWAKEPLPTGYELAA
jgi:DNA-binding CsgD family transcriptional regulator